MTDSREDPRTLHWAITRELEPRLISHFLAVIDNRTMSRAAEVLNITQPALSKSIKRLEDRLGVTLFERWPTGIKPTAYAEVLARRGRLIQRELSYAVAELHSMKGGAKGVIKVGAGPVWARHYLPPVLTEFLRARPLMQIDLQTGVIDTLVPRLLSGDCDVICTTLDFPDSSDVIKEPLVKVVHGIFAREGHPLLNKGPISPAELADWDWITIKNDYVGHNRLGAFFAANGLSPPNVIMQVAPDVAVLKMIALSDYICTMPVVLKDIAANYGVHQIDFPDSKLWDSTAGIAYRHSEYAAPAVNTFLTMVRDHMEAEKKKA